MLLRASNVRKAELGLKTGEKHLAVFLARISHSFPSSPEGEKLNSSCVVCREMAWNVDI